MKKNIIISIKIVLVISMMAALTGCIKDGLVECPEGNVRVHLYAERFQNISEDPLADRENVFSERINHLRYYLYKEGQLVQQDVLNLMARSSQPNYTLSFNGIGYGNYRLVVVANSTKNALGGNPVNADNLLLTFPGSADTEDYFTAVFPFTITSNDPVEYEVGLLRTQGVIRYKFINMPADVSDIDVVIENVSNEKWITGDYAVLARANNRYIINSLSRKKQDEVQDYVMGTFPTMKNQRSAYYLSIYRSGEIQPYTTRLISDTLNVRRNQLLEVIATFNTANDIDFQINMDATWDGSSTGEVGIQ